MPRRSDRRDCACRGPPRCWHPAPGSPGDLAAEDHVAAGDRYAADHRLAGMIAPALRAGGGIERGQPAPRVGPRVELEFAAEELAPPLFRLRVGRLRCRSDLVAPIGRRHEQYAEPRAVGGAVPLVTAKEA